MRFFSVVMLIIIVSGCATVRKPAADNGEDIVAKELKEEPTLQKQTDILYDKAYQAYLDGDYENAIVSFESAGLLDPEKMQFWRKLALSYCLIATGRYQDAQKLTLSLIREKPDYWKSYMNMGLIHLWQGRFSKAESYFLKSQDFQDAEPSVNLYLGITYQLMKRKKSANQQFDSAEKDYQQIMKNNPNDEQAFIELAYLYLYSDRQQMEIVNLLDQAQKIIEDSDNLEKKKIWINFYLPHLRGIWFYKEGNHLQSILTLTKALEHAPTGVRVDLAEVYYYLGKNYLALKDMERTKYFFEKALAIDKLVLYQRDIRSFLGTSKTTKKKQG